MKTFVMTSERCEIIAWPERTSRLNYVLVLNGEPSNLK